jgi:hypothetical protein
VHLVDYEKVARAKQNLELNGTDGRRAEASVDLSIYILLALTRYYPGHRHP